MVDFVEINLIKEWPFRERMDIVLLRNVLIYFGIETKKQVLAKLPKILKPDGYLFLGSAETTLNLDNVFKIVNLGQTIGYRL